ncbi:polyketide cyclase [Phycicoccus sp. Root563]|uniref:SRPBCC family protein n=1 Tax=unclassified Phycicoccus TaxID=2637926 RepID=UPI0007028E8E|nr:MULTISPECIES: SRPBCC family protein [unclassified Phycicoccus]KQU68128.1 polyketide cyclase [Phycicoccus sp. Root101]KQZ89937.1 polyketide cyclase [Phycicoccus sp. Root563]
MVDVIRMFSVPRSPQEVVAYLSDFSNAVAWDPGTVRCERVGSGPVQVGSTWKNTSKVLGRETELDYVLTTLEPDHVVLKGTNKTATSTDDITVEPDGSGSKVTYHAHIVFNGIAKLAEPLMQRVFEKLGDETVEGITRELGAGRAA